MQAATWPRSDTDLEQLLVIDDGGAAVGHIRDLEQHFRSGDVVVVNDAATVPASFFGHLAGEPVELRLLRMVDDVTWDAVLFGEGDWHTPTERRATPPMADVDDVISIDASLFARVIAVGKHQRLVRVRFDGDVDDVWSSLYRLGHPIQYAHVKDELPLWAVQTTFSARPWAVELPSAGRPLSVSLLLALRRRGVVIATLTHAAGISSTGDDVIDATLPLPERSDIPTATIDAIARARAGGGRVIAVGTTVVRALEGSVADHGALRAGEHTTAFKLGPTTRLQVVDAILTGMHEEATSHYQLLQAFAPRHSLERAYDVAIANGFVCHEFGDSCLIFADDSPVTRVPSSTMATATSSMMATTATMATTSVSDARLAGATLPS